MQFRRARFLSTRLHDPPAAPRGCASAPASLPWPWCRPPSGGATPGPSGESFHCLSGSCDPHQEAEGAALRRVIENQYLMQDDARAHQHLLELGDRCGKTPRTPSSVQKPITRSTPARLYQLRSKSTISPPAGRCGDVALEVPLGALALVGRGQRGHPADARVQALGDALDGPALAGRVAALEQHHDLELLGRPPSPAASPARPAGAAVR